MEKILLKDGWYFYRTVGSHYQYKHESKPGKVTIPRHCKELKTAVVASIQKQAGLKEGEKEK